MSSWTVYKMKITCTLESLQNVFHGKKQMEVDRGVLALKCEKDRKRMLEQCSSALPCDFEELRRAMMLKREEGSAEQAVQELLADEAATKAAGTKKAKKGKHKKETVDSVRFGNRVTGAVKKHHVQNEASINRQG